MIKRVSSFFSGNSIANASNNNLKPNEKCTRPKKIMINEEILQREYEVSSAKSTNVANDLKRYIKKRYIPNKNNLKRLFFNFFPIIEWLPKYKFKEYFLRDLIGGLTLGIVLIPQTMGYSLNGVNV